MTHPLHAPALDDDALLQLAATGDVRAFEEIVRRHEQHLRRFCRLLVRDDALARDLAQESFLRVWQVRATYRPEGRLRELLLATARNLCRSHHRKEAVRTLFGLTRAQAEPRVSDGDGLEEKERTVLVARALEQLPEKFRTPLALRFVEELSYEEIARVIGRTESAARSRVFYGLKALAALLPPEMLP